MIFNVTYAHFCTNKPDSAPFRIAKTNALHPRTQHFNISPPAGPRWWHTPRSQRRQSSTRSQRATSGRARTARIGTIRHATQRPSQRSARLARAPRARNAATSCACRERKAWAVGRRGCVWIPCGFLLGLALGLGVWIPLWVRPVDSSLPA